MTFTTSFFAVLIPAALLAGVVRGFAGFGGPLTLLPALNVFMPTSAAILVMSWIDLLACRGRRLRRRPAWWCR